MPPRPDPLFKEEREEGMNLCNLGNLWVFVVGVVADRKRGG